MERIPLVFLPGDFEGADPVVAAARANEKFSRWLDEQIPIFAWRDHGKWEAHQHNWDVRNRYMGRLIVKEELT